MRMNRLGKCMVLVLGALALGACGKDAGKPADKADGKKPVALDGFVYATAGLDMRAAPSGSAATLGKVAFAARVTVVSNGPAAAIDGIKDTWVYVKAEERTGWLFGGHVARQPESGPIGGGPATGQDIGALVVPGVPADPVAAQARFGKPLAEKKETRRKAGGTADDVKHALRFPGIALTYYKEAREDDWHLGNLEIVSANVNVLDGLGIGARIETVVRRLGYPLELAPDRASYGGGAVAYVWRFREGMVSSISAAGSWSW